LTDPSSGVTYITFAGPGGVRDPNRKWGHYDSELPVFVSGVKISGRLTSSSANGSYVLRIKNFDHMDGLLPVPNQGELVNALDRNPIQAAVGSGVYNYWLDLDGDGEVDMTDLNIATFHMNHTCNFPTNP